MAIGDKRDPEGMIWTDAAGWVPAGSDDLIMKSLRESGKVVGELMTWQPIDSAPAGTNILIWDGWEVCVARLGAMGWLSMGCDGPAIKSQDDFGTDYQEPCAPRAWMPLPTPPLL